MTKQTTGQVAQALRISKQRVYTTLFHYPALRPSERLGKQKLLLWSDAEIAALRAHLRAHAYKQHRRLRLLG